MNNINAVDDGNNNQWDNGTIGNYWDDYGGISGSMQNSVVANKLIYSRILNFLENNFITWFFKNIPSLNNRDKYKKKIIKYDLKKSDKIDG